MAKNVVTKIILEAERRGQAAFTGTEKDLKALASTAAIAGAAAAGALAAVTARSFNQLDALAKTADLLGANTEQLAALQFAANITGNETQKFNIGLQRMTRRIAEAATGTGEASAALRELGVDAVELVKLPVEQQFQAISNALANVDGQSTKVRLGFKLFDSEGVALIRTADKLANEGLAAVTEEAQRLGLAVSRVDTAKIEAANDAMLTVRARVQGIGNIIAIEVAPAITAMATAFVEAGGDATAMRDRVRAAVDGIAVGVGIVADAFLGWKLIFRTVEIGVLATAEGMVRALHTVERASIAAQNAVRRVFDLEQIDPQQSTLFLMADSLAQSRHEAEAMLSNLAAAPKPSEEIAAALQQARIDADEAAQAIARLREENTAGTSTVVESELAEAARLRAEETAAREREQLQKRLEAIDTFLLDKAGREQAAFLQRHEILVQALEAEIITEERFRIVQARLAKNLQDKLTEIAKEGWTEREKFAAMSSQAQTKHVIDSLVTMTQGVATTNKTLFKINKAAAIAQAIVNTAEGVTKALSAYPPPLSFAMAAAQAAAGAAQIQAIRSATFGGGTTPSVAGSTPTYQDQPVFQPQAAPERDTTPQTIVQVTLTGIVGTVDRGTAVAIGEALADVIDAGDLQIISPQSRNAADIVETGT